MSTLIFTPGMMRAIQEGRKTQTRRALKYEIHKNVKFWITEDGWGNKWETHPRTFCYSAPFFPGQIRQATSGGDHVNIKIVRVWVERVQDISSYDARAEGVYTSHCANSPGCGASDCSSCRPKHQIEDFQELWDSIYSEKAPWSSNPWVWCCEFEVAK